MALFIGSAMNMIIKQYTKWQNDQFPQFKILYSCVIGLGILIHDRMILVLVMV